MPYGIIKIDTITFTDGGVDKSVSISGLVQNPTFSGNITVTGTVSGNTIQGQTVSGVTVTGTTSNFASGVFTTQISGATVTGNVGSFTTITGGTVTLTSGVFGAGTASAPSIAFTGDTNTGIYSPGADQVAISTGGAGRLFIGSAGAVGVGASDPGYALDVAAADTTAGLGYALRLRANSTAGAAAIQFTNNPVSAEYSVIAGDSSNNLKFLTSGSERLRIASDGQVSIGTSDAKAPLHLFGAGQATASIADAGARGCFLRLSDNSAAPGAGGAILFANIQSDSSNSLGFAAIKGLLIDGANNTRGDISFSTRANNTDSSLTERMRIAADGAVGIGRTPAYTLDVAGGARFGATTGEVNLELGAGATGNRAVYIDFVGDTTYTDYGFRIIRLNEGANSASQFDHRGTGDLALNTADAAPLIFRTNSSERLRITPAGYIGIGQSTPNTRLHVNDGEFTISTGGNVSDAGGIINFGITALSTFSPMASVQGLLSNATGTELQGGLGFFTRPVGTAGQTLQRRMMITSQGNVGIGTTSPQGLCDVAGSNGRLVLANGNTSGGMKITAANAAYSANGYLAFEGYSSEYGRFDSSGRLLVGTSSAVTTVISAGLQVQSSGANAYASIGRWDNNVAGPGLLLNKSRGSSAGTRAVVQSGDILGEVSFMGDDGTSFITGAQILSVVDGTPGTNDMPGRLVFSTTADGASSPTERMRISNTGNSYIVSTTNVIALSTTLEANSSNYLIRGLYSGTAGSVESGTTSFYVYTNGNVQNTNNSYGAISDIKLKENIVHANSQWDDLKALQVRNYNFKEGQTHTQIGLIAQEVELVSPGLVSESPDRDAEGNDLGTVTKSVNYSVLYMKAVKALQEAMERIEALEAKVVALESKP